MQVESASLQARSTDQWHEYQRIVYLVEYTDAKMRNN